MIAASAVTLLVTVADRRLRTKAPAAAAVSSPPAKMNDHPTTQEKL